MNKKRKVILTVGVLALLVSIALSLFVNNHMKTESQKGWEGAITARIDSSFQKDPFGHIWYQVGSRLIIESVEGNQIEIPIQEDELLYNFIFDSHGNLWTCTSSGLLIRDSNGSWNSYPSPLGPDPMLRLLAFDKDGRAWVRWGNEYSLSFVDLNQINFTYSYQPQSTLTYGPGNFIPVSIGLDGNLWTIHNEELKTYSPDGLWILKSSGDFSEINSLVFDPQGKIWLGGGMDQIRVVNQDFTMSTYNSGVNGETVRIEEVDSDGQVWGRIGRGYSGLYSFTPGKGGTVYNTGNSGLPDNTIRDVAVDDVGVVWVALQSGIVKFDPSQESTSTLLPYREFIRKVLFPAVPIFILLITLNALAFSYPGAANRKNRGDFTIGFLGWLILTGFFLFGINTLSEAMGESGMALIICLLFPILATLIALIIFWIKRRWIVLGIVSGVLVGIIIFILYLADVGKLLG